MVGRGHVDERKRTFVSSLHSFFAVSPSLLSPYLGFFKTSRLKSASTWEKRLCPSHHQLQCINEKGKLQNDVIEWWLSGTLLFIAVDGGSIADSRRRVPFSSCIESIFSREREREPCAHSGHCNSMKQANGCQVSVCVGYLSDDTGSSRKRKE